jgi:hypothetical protein
MRKNCGLRIWEPGVGATTRQSIESVEPAGGSEVAERTVIARSIGSRAAKALRPGTTGRVLASFPRVCDLVTDAEAVIALACREAEKGPLTVLLDPGPTGELMEKLPPGTAFQTRMGGLRLTPGSLPPVRVDLSGAAHWESRLHWEALQPRSKQIRSSAKTVSRVMRQAQGIRSELRWERRLSQASGAVLKAQNARDWHELGAAIHDLCGLGEGLTPQGDDWVAGWLLGTRLVESSGPSGWASRVLCALVLDAANERTTVLSCAFLACASARGAPESWHLLLSQMAQYPVDECALDGATRRILSQGATSGRAMLEGFLAGLGSPSAPHPPIRSENTVSLAME